MRLCNRTSHECEDAEYAGCFHMTQQRLLESTRHNRLPSRTFGRPRRRPEPRPLSLAFCSHDHQSLVRSQFGKSGNSARKSGRPPMLYHCAARTIDRYFHGLTCVSAVGVLRKETKRTEPGPWAWATTLPCSAASVPAHQRSASGLCCIGRITCSFCIFIVRFRRSGQLRSNVRY